MTDLRFAAYRCPDDHADDWRCTYIGPWPLPDQCPVHGGQRFGSEPLDGAELSNLAGLGWEHPDQIAQPELDYTGD